MSVSEVRDVALFRYAPGDAVPKAVRDSVGKILGETGGERLLPVDFRWERLSGDTFVELNREQQTVVLNSKYREKILAGQSASKTDAVVIKMLLFFLFHDEFDRKTSSGKYREWLGKINQSILEAIPK
jgi:hypothetical protein